MELAQEKIDLLERIIRSDKKFMNNEDLYDDFFNEAYKRSFLVVKSVNDYNSLESYLRRIVTTAIVVVLKDLGRVRRTGEGFVSVHETPLETVGAPAINFNDIQAKAVELQEPHATPSEQPSSYSDVKIVYNIVDPADGPEEIVIKNELLQKVVDAVALAHCGDISKQYMPLYEMRYVKGLKQREIAEELNISQSEVSKRLFELMEAVKKSFET